MTSLSRFAYRMSAGLTIVMLAFAALPVMPARAATAHFDGPPGCPNGSLVCLPFLQIIWGSPPSDPANGTFAMSINNPGDGSVTLYISQLQVRVAYAAPTTPPPNAPPTAPTSIDQYRIDGTTAIAPGGLTNETQVVFKANASDPESEQYKLEVEVVPAASAFSSSATCSSPLVASGNEASTGACGAFSDGASYEWQYRLVDSAGASTSWTPFGASDPDFTVDTTSPVASLTSTPPAMSGPSAQFEFTGSDVGGVASFQCQLDGSGFTSCTSPATFDSLTDGSHSFEVQAIDNAGNVGSPASFTWIVDATPPSATIAASPTNPSNVSTPTFSFTGDDGAGSGVAGFQCQIDGGGFAPCKSGDSFGPLTDGSHTFQVEAIDNAGNVGSPASGTWVLDATPPTAAITASPTNPSNVATPTFSFSGDDGTGTGIAGFQCQMDSGGFAPCKSGDSFGPLTDGSHTFEVEAIDNAGNVGSPASGTWVLDTTPPTVTITTSPANPSNVATSAFEFTGDDGTGTGIAGFQCQIDSAGFGPCKSGDSFGPLADGSHTFEVEAIDNAANVGSPASYSWTIALAMPTAVSIQTGPSNPTNSTSATFTFSTSGSPTAVECALDAGSFAPCDSPTSQSYAGPLSESAHTFTVRVTDAAGQTNSDSRTWTIDVTAPTVSITSSPTNPSNSATAAFEFTGADGTGSGVASFQCQMDSGGFAPCKSGDSFGPLSDGSHTFEVEAVDHAGNSSTPASVTWTVDTTPPTVTVTGTPPSITGASAQFEFIGSDADGVASFECQVDEGGFAACTSPVSLASLSDGSHTFQVRAIDEAGNVGSAASITWTADTVGPTTIITDQPPTLSTSASATFTFTGNDGTGSGIASFQCKIDAGAYLPCTSPATFGPLPDGLHALSLFATDNMGNAGPIVSYSWTISSTVPTPTPTP